MIRLISGSPQPPPGLFWNFAGEHGFAKQKGVLGGVRRGDAADRHRDPDCHAHAVQLTAAADSPADGNRFAEPEPESEPAFSHPAGAPAATQRGDGSRRMHGSAPSGGYAVNLCWGMQLGGYLKPSPSTPQLTRTSAA